MEGSRGLTLNKNHVTRLNEEPPNPGVCGGAPRECARPAAFISFMGPGGNGPVVLKDSVTS